MKRPELTEKIEASTFKDFYYLKEELVAFCKKNDLQTTGSKSELNERIMIFLETGKRITRDSSTKNNKIFDIKLNSIIEKNIKCSEIHRAFFKAQLGNSFSFNVEFQKWLKENEGKTYDEACKAYLEIKQRKRNSKTVIDKQFEYNTYIRDFFEDNKGKTLNDAIKCWKFKKSSAGHNKYERADLSALR